MQQACTASNVVVLRPYYDVRSGALADRPGFQRLLKDAIVETPTYIVVPRLSVAVRQIDDILKLAEVLKSSGTVLVPADARFGEPPEGFISEEELYSRLLMRNFANKYLGNNR